MFVPLSACDDCEVLSAEHHNGQVLICWNQRDNRRTCFVQKRAGMPLHPLHLTNTVRVSDRRLKSVKVSRACAIPDADADAQLEGTRRRGEGGSWGGRESERGGEGALML